MKRDDSLNSDDQQPDSMEERELRRLLASWRTPEIPIELDQRALASYRRRFNRWRWLTLSIRIPVPVAAMALLLLCATSFLAARNATSNSIESPPAPAATEFVKIPVPVVQEKIVTRVIRLKAEHRNPKPGSANPARAARSDLAGFRPVEEIKIIVISEDHNNEK